MYVQTSVEFYYQRFFLVFVIEINSFKHRHFLKKKPTDIGCVNMIISLNIDFVSLMYLNFHDLYPYTNTQNDEKND